MSEVAVLGASSDPSRYAFKAMNFLKEEGHTPVPVTPKEDEVLGIKTWQSLGALADAGRRVDTVTVYVGPALSTKMQADFLKLAPRRVIFNPGAENPPLESALREAGVEVVDGCTLVMLRTGQF